MLHRNATVKLDVYANSWHIPPRQFGMNLTRNNFVKRAQLCEIGAENARRPAKTVPNRH
jgi:hypothetical protein